MANDKKKLVIVGSLVLSLVAVGAFQVINGGGGNSDDQQVSAKKDASKKVAAKEGDTPAEEQGNKYPDLAALPSRDPFKVGVVGKTPDLAVNTPAKQTAMPEHTPGVRIPMGANGRTIPPFGFDNGVPTGVMGLPSANGAPGPNGLPGAASTKPVHIEPTYQVSGVIVGPHSAAVIVDSQGKQRLVTPGSKLDADTKIVSVEKGRVVVEVHGKRQTLTSGGNSNNGN